MKNSIFKNMGLKILALIISVIVWLVVVNLSDPVVSIPFNGVTVEILNSDVITNQGKVYEVLDETDNISVNISAKRTILNYLSKDNIRATADMNELRDDGTVRIRVESNRYSDNIDSIKPKTEYLKVNIENLERSQFIINPVISGEPTESYVVGDVTMDENVVRISGPESVVTRIKKVTAEVSVANMSSSMRTGVELRLYDENDVLIEDKNITKNISNVNVSIDILATKEVSIVFGITGNAAHGYGATGKIISDPKTIVVAGKPSVLAVLKEITVPDTAISTEGASSNVVQTIDITKYLPEGLIMADKEGNSKVAATAQIVELDVKEIEFSKTKISISGDILDGYKTSIQNIIDPVKIEVMGLPEELEGIEAEDISAAVDVDDYVELKKLEGLEEGIYVMPVNIKLPGNLKLKNQINLTVRISKKSD